jgi:hypothetical protein
VVLSVTGELPSALSVFLQGTTSVGPFLYGDGLRCVGGTLKRLFVKRASNGSITAPQPGDPSVSARSAQLGDTILVGRTRYYTVGYRDPGYLNGCTGTINMTPSGSVVWGP